MMTHISETQSRLRVNALSRTVLRFVHQARGSAAVELAVVLPVLALLVLGVADFGRAFVTGSVVAHAAKAGAQYGSQGPAYAVNADAIRVAATQDAADVSSITVSSRSYCSCGGAEITCSSGSCGAYGEPRMFVAVTVSKTFQFLVKYPGLPQSIAMTRVATLRVQ